MTPGDIIHIAGARLIVVDETPEPVEIQLTDKDGKPRECRVMLATVREAGR